MNTTIFWIVGGVAATAVILFAVWRWLNAYLRGPQSNIPVSHYHQSAELPSLPDIVVDEPVTAGGAEPAVVLEAADPLAGVSGEWGSGEPVAMGIDAAGSDEAEEMLRMDVAVPPQVEVGRAFDLAVALRQLNAPLLAEEELTRVASGPVAVTWEDVTETAVVRIQVTAPDCDIDTPEQSVALVRRRDEPPVYFLLTPRRTGRISIQVKVYQADLLLGNARLKTEAAEEVGYVALEVTSHPLTLTPNDRRLLRKNLTDGYDLGELYGLIFSLGLDKDNFPREKDELIIDLIQTCLQQGLLRDLVAVCREERPLLLWQLESLLD